MNTIEALKLAASVCADVADGKANFISSHTLPKVSEAEKVIYALVKRAESADLFTESRRLLQERGDAVYMGDDPASFREWAEENDLISPTTKDATIIKALGWASTHLTPASDDASSYYQALKTHFRHQIISRINKMQKKRKAKEEDTL